MKEKIKFTKECENEQFSICVANLSNDSLLEISPFPLGESEAEFLNLCDVSPDGEKIAFSFFNGNDKEIYIVGIDGKNLINLSNDHTKNDEYPSFSPDGEKVAFIKNADNNKREIYLVKIDGTNLIKLSNSPESDDYYPVFSLDSKKLFFISDKDGNKEIYSVNADGTNLRNLTEDQGDEEFFELSPDGKIIAYSSVENEKVKIYLMNTDGSNKKIITDKLIECGALIWSPNGEKLAIEGKMKNPSLGTYPNLNDIFLVDKDGKNFHNFTNTPMNKEFFGYWSSLGSKFTFRQYESDLWVDSIIFVADVIIEKYKAIECPIDHCWENGGEFSLDGKKILYGICIDRGTWDLCVANDKGKFLKRITETTPDEGTGVISYEWFNDSNWIAYTYNIETIPPRPSNSKLFVENIDTGERIELSFIESMYIKVIH